MYEVTVGWDDPLETYFAQVVDPNAEDEDDSMRLWVGGEPKDKVTTVDALRERIYEYAMIPEDIAEKLYQDYVNRTEPSPLQRHMRAMFEE